LPSACAAHQHHHVREVVDQAPRKVCAALPLSFSRAPSTPRKSIRSKLPRDGIEAGRVDDDVEFVLRSLVLMPSGVIRSSAFP